MRALVGTVVTAFAASACASSTDSGGPAGVPELSIDSLRAGGPRVRHGDGDLDGGSTFDFGVPAEGEPAPVHIVLRARCDVSGSTEGFGALAIAGCDAFDAGRIPLREGRLTMTGSAG